MEPLGDKRRRFRHAANHPNAAWMSTASTLATSPMAAFWCASDATSQCVPCWHGVARKSVANLFVMNRDGHDMRRVTFDQDHDMHPAVLEDGQVVYNRWDYTGINRVFLRPLMVMNPDGTGQRSLYGSNSWFPNGLYSPRELPGQPGRLLCILAGYHGPGRTGHLVLGRHESRTPRRRRHRETHLRHGAASGNRVHGPVHHAGLAQVSRMLSDHRQAVSRQRVDVRRVAEHGNLPRRHLRQPAPAS